MDRLGDIQHDFFLGQLLLEFANLLFDNIDDHGLAQPIKEDDTIQAVSEFGGEDSFHRFGNGAAADPPFAESDLGLPDFPGAGIGGHNDNHVAEIRFPTVVVRQGCIVHNLQEGIEDVRMGFFNLVQQKHRMGHLADGFGQETAFLIAHVARRCPDQPGNGMFLLVLRHIVPVQRNAQREGELARQLCLSDSRRSGKEQGGDRFVLILKAGPGTADGLYDRVNRPVLTEYLCFQILVEALQTDHFRGRDRFLRNP